MEAKAVWEAQQDLLTAERDLEADGEPVPFRSGDLIVRDTREAKVEKVYPHTRSLVAYYTDGSGDGGNFKWDEIRKIEEPTPSAA